MGGVLVCQQGKHNRGNTKALAIKPGPYHSPIPTNFLLDLPVYLVAVARHGDGYLLGTNLNCDRIVARRRSIINDIRGGSCT